MTTGERTSNDWTRVTEAEGGYLVHIAPTFHAGTGIMLATLCTDTVEAHRFSRLVQNFLDRMIVEIRDGGVDEAEPIVADASYRWTKVYLDRGWYVRLVPHMMDLEAAGYPHGLALLGSFTEKPRAREWAREIEAEMARILASFGETLDRDDAMRATIGILTGGDRPTGPETTVGPSN